MGSTHCPPPTSVEADSAAMPGSLRTLTPAMNRRSRLRDKTAADRGHRRRRGGVAVAHSGCLTSKGPSTQRGERPALFSAAASVGTWRIEIRRYGF